MSDGLNEFLDFVTWCIVGWVVVVGVGWFLHAAFHVGAPSVLQVLLIGTPGGAAAWILVKMRDSGGL